METNLKARLATAAAGLPLLIALVVWGQTWLFVTLVIVAGCQALHEFFRMAFPGDFRAQLSGLAFGLGLSLALLLPPLDLSALFAGLWIAALCMFYLVVSPAEERLKRLSWTLLGGLYLGYLFPHLAILFRSPSGRAWVLLVLAVIMSGDAAAYWIGRRYGRKRLAPQLSPAKTVAGAVAYVIGGAIAGIAAASYLLPELGFWEALLVSTVLTVLGQAGDLFESSIKRAFAVKDTGALLPGHGGLLDRVDSLIFPVVFTSAYVRLLHS